jgi:hypothetical protein
MFNSTEATVGARSKTLDENDIVQRRNKSVIEQAHAAGLLGAVKDARLAGRIPRRLLDAAKQRTGLTSDTDLIELALARLALEDDFASKLLARRGSVPADIDLEF